MDRSKLIEQAWGWKPLSRLASKLLVREAFDIVRKKPGEVPFKRSTISDPHIREMVDRASAKTGIPTGELDAKINQTIARIEDFKKYSFVLYDTLAQNAVEKAAFDLIQHAEGTAGFDAKRQMFDLPTFFKLIKMVELEHDQFFPLRAPGETNYIFHMDPIIVPNSDPKFKKFDGVRTAAATAKGEFIFNKPFMQKLIDFATIEQLHPQGKKYQSNGGPIPDAYSYIEFLIMHELLHYTYGDFAAGKRLSQYSHKVHNWASDFRSNYMLVKNGYDQLPIGLFSDHINYDRQGSYDSMVKLVHDELAKLPKDKQDEFKDLADLDDHEPGEKSREEQEGDGPGGDGPGGDGPGGDGPGGDGPGGDGPGGGNVPSQDDIQKDVEDKMRKRNEIGSDEEAEDAEKQKVKKRPQQQGPQAHGRGEGPLGDLQSRADEIANIKPKLPWKALIRKMLSSSVPAIDQSYAKPARRSVTGISVAAALGASAVKPGERSMQEQHNKVLLVFDTSGSMYDVIPRVMTESQALLGLMGKSKFPIGVVFFAGEAQWYQINMAANTYSRIHDIANLGKPMARDSKTNWKDLLSKGGTGGTEFTGDLTSKLATLASQGWNLMIFSDAGVIYDAENWNSLSGLWKNHKGNVFFVADSLDTFRRACDKLGQVPQTWTHL
jgi:predicted metal-dependent peptidase